MKRAITTVLGPNYEVSDVFRSLRLLVTPWHWLRGPDVTDLETDIARWLPVRHAIGFASGRSALLAILQSCQLQSGDEVLVQAFTCVSVPSAVIWAGGKPVYVDTDASTYTLDVSDLQKKITARTRAVIVQHTFGYPADLGPICAVARARKILVIEDCAHALGARYQGKQVGVFGDAAIFSFGRDKVISSVFGGLAVTNDGVLAKKLRVSLNRLVPAPARWVAQQLLHPTVTYTARRWLDCLSREKIFLRMARGCHVFSSAIKEGGRVGREPGLIGYRMPQALAVLARHQFRKLERYNRHRAAIAQYYQDHLPSGFVQPPASAVDRTNIFLMFSVRVHQREAFMQRMRKKGVYLEEWYNPVIAPPGVDFAALSYREGSCPQAEQASREVVNLPTHFAFTKDDAKRIVESI